MWWYRKQYLIRLIIQTIVVARKITQEKKENHIMAQHIPYTICMNIASKKYRKKGKSNRLHTIFLSKHIKITYLIIRWTVRVICEFSTATESFRWYPYKEIIKPRGSWLGNVAWFRYQRCSRYLQCYGVRYA